MEQPEMEAPQGRNSIGPGRKSWVAEDKSPSPLRDDTVFTKAPKTLLLQNSATALLSLDNFAELPLAMQRRLLKQLLESQQIAVNFEHIEKLLRCALGETRRAELPGGWLAMRQGGCLELRASRKAPPFSGYQYCLPVPGEIYIPELGLTVRALPVAPEFAKDVGTPENLLSAELLGPGLTIRNWQPGDRFHPTHTGSEKKLKHLFAEQHIPAEQRATWPIVLQGDKIVWVRGFPAARAFAWSGSGDAVKIEVL